jgi:hypothetical protein
MKGENMKDWRKESYFKDVKEQLTKLNLEIPWEQVEYHYLVKHWACDCVASIIAQDFNERAKRLKTFFTKMEEIHEMKGES